MFLFKFTNWMTNSVDPDQMASSEAIWSGSTLFTKVGLVVNSRIRVKVMSSQLVHLIILFLGMLSAVSSLTSICANCFARNWCWPSWISGRDRMTVENISWSISMKECCQTWRWSKLQSDHQSDTNLTEPQRTALCALFVLTVHWKVHFLPCD